MRLGAAIVCALAAWAGPVAAGDGQTWRVEPHGITFEMTAADLRAWVGDPKGTPAFSAAALLAGERKKFDEYADELARALLAPDPPTYGDSNYYEETTVEALSIVGPLLVYRESGGGYSPGAAHPSRYAVLKLLDLRRKDATPSLLDYFSEKELVAALKADRWIRKFDNGEGAFKRAGSLKELLEALDRAFAQGNAEEGDCRFDVSFDSDGMVQQFYFHHLAGKQVAVRILVPPASEWCNRASGEQEIGLLLPIPAALREDLLKAQDGAGLLAGNRKGGLGKYGGEMWEVDVAELAEKLRKKK